MVVSGRGPRWRTKLPREGRGVTRRVCAVALVRARGRVLADGRDMNPADASIVIVTKNGGDLWARVLEGLARCDGFRDADVLVVDSGSSDRTLEHARKYPWIRIHTISPEEFGHGKTRNLGARMTDPRRPALVFLVQDATPTGPGFLRELLAPLADPRVAGVFGRQIAYDWTNAIEKMFMAEQYPAESVVRGWDGAGRPRIRDIFFSNVCSAIRRRVFDEIPFDESLIISEDQQWSKSALLAGHKVAYQATAAVYHSHNYPLKQLFKRNFDSGASLLEIAGDSVADLVRYELGHVASGVRSLAEAGNTRLIPFFFAYEATRAVGVAAGRQAHRLPGPILRALSLHAYHWARGAR